MAAADWFAATAVADPLPAPARRRRGAERPARAARTQSRAPRRHVHRVRAPIVWMVVFAVLLAGVVAMNVAVLRANVSVNDLNQQIAQKHNENQLLQSEVSAATSPPKVEAWARHNGLLQAPAAGTGYLALRPHP